MIIKRNTLFFLQAKKGADESYIRMQVRWNKTEVVFNIGYTISPDKWSTDTQRCKKGAMNKKRFNYTVINREIQRLENMVESIFQRYEDNQIMPTAQDLKNDIHRMNGKQSKVVIKTFSECLTEFCQEQSILNGWSNSTLVKLRTLNGHINTFKPEMQIKEFNEKNLIQLVYYFQDVAGLKNTTTLKNISLIKWVLKWAYKKKYLTCDDYKDFSPKLKIVYDKEVIFLTWDELMTLYNFNFPEGRGSLSQVRDVFCFQCFTSLRYSDVFNLKKSDISDDKFTIVTIKTGSTITIELNKYSKAILEKYKDMEGDKALPVISNQKFNKFLKEVCFVAGINSPVVLSYYKGNERIEEIKQKYELIGTHTGRRTFICNALAMGIPPQTVMEWTGHSDYKAMKPYIAVANEEKRKAMKLFDEK